MSVDIKKLFDEAEKKIGAFAPVPPTQNEPPQEEVVPAANSVHDDFIKRVFDKAESALKLKKQSAAVAQENLANRNEFMRGLYRGIDSLQATYEGGLGMYNAAMGNQAAAEQRFRNYQEQMRQASENPATVTDFFSTDPKTGAFASPGNFGTYVAGTLGQAVPSLTEAVASGIAGAAIGAAIVPAPDPADAVTIPAGAIGGFLGRNAMKRAIASAAQQYVQRGVAKDAAEQMADKYVRQAVASRIARNVGSGLAVSQTTALHEGGGMYAEGQEQGYDSPMSAMALGQVSGFSEALFGAAPTAVRAIMGKAAVNEVAKKSGIRAAAGYAWDVAKNAAEEGVQEGFQEFLGSVNKEIADPKFNINSKENFMQWAEAAAAGAVTGGVVGGGSVGLQAIRDRRQQLEEIQAKGFVSESDAKKAGIEGASRRERMANLEAEREELSNLEAEASRQSDMEFVKQQLAGGMQVDESGQFVPQVSQADLDREFARRMASQGGNVTTPQTDDIVSPPPLPALSPETAQPPQAPPAAQQPSVSQPASPSLTPEQASQSDREFADRMASQGGNVSTPTEEETPASFAARMVDKILKGESWTPKELEYEQNNNEAVQAELEKLLARTSEFSPPQPSAPSVKPAAEQPAPSLTPEQASQPEAETASEWVDYGNDSYGLKIESKIGKAEATLSFDGDVSRIYVDMFSRSIDAPTGSGKELLRQIVAKSSQYNPEYIEGNFGSKAALGAFASVFGESNIQFFSKDTGSPVDVNLKDAMNNPGRFIARAMIATKQPQSVEPQPTAPPAEPVAEQQKEPWEMSQSEARAQGWGDNWSSVVRRAVNQKKDVPAGVLDELNAYDKERESKAAIAPETPKVKVGDTVVRYTHKDGTGLLNNNGLDRSKLTDEEESELTELMDFGLQQPTAGTQGTFYFTKDGEQKHKRMLDLLKKASKTGIVRAESTLEQEPSWESSDGQIAVVPKQGLKKQPESLEVPQSTSDIASPAADIDAMMEGIMSQMGGLSVTPQQKQPSKGKKKPGGEKKGKKSEGTKAQAANKREQAKQAMLDAFKDSQGRLPSGLDIEVATKVAKAAKLYIEAGALEFKAFIENLVEDFGDAWVRDKKPYLESAWRTANKLEWVDSPAGSVDDILPTAKADAKEVMAPSKEQAPAEKENEVDKTLRQAGLKVERLANGTWQITGNTYEHSKEIGDVKREIRELGGFWDKYGKRWTFKADPRRAIADRISGKGAGEKPSDAGSSDEQMARESARRREDEKADVQTTGESYAASVDGTTRDLIRRGLKFGMTEEVMKNQIEDIGRIVSAAEKGLPMFVVGSAPGTGKTFVLGGAIRELRNRGFKRFVYVTQNQDLIGQVQGNLADYGLDGVEFITYAKALKSPPNTQGAVLLLDEAHTAKNLGRDTGKKVASMVKNSEFTVYATATPFENVTEAEYIGYSGIFDDLRVEFERPSNKPGKPFRNELYGFKAWAWIYGANVYFVKQTDARGNTYMQPVVWWDKHQTSEEDQLAANEWLKKRGVYVQRPMALPEGVVNSELRSVEADPYWAEISNNVVQIYAEAEAAAESNQEKGQINAHKKNLLKKLLEASKVDAAIARAKELIGEGKKDDPQVIIFVNTKVDTNIGTYTLSEPYRAEYGIKGKEATRRYAPSEVDEMMQRWYEQKAIAQEMGDSAGPPPFAPFIHKIAMAMERAGTMEKFPSVIDKIMDAFPGQAVEYSGRTASQNSSNLAKWKNNEAKLIVATMDKGGTGLSFHDTTGTMPSRYQVNMNLPWSGTKVEQVSGRLARYGTAKPVNIEWIFANNIPFDRELSKTVGSRMRSMAAAVQGRKSGEAKQIRDFDFEDSPVVDDNVSVTPWSDATVEDEGRWAGTSVNVSAKGKEEGYAGKVVRVLNKGETIEVQRDGFDAAVRVPAERVSVVDLVDSKFVSSAEQADKTEKILADMESNQEKMRQDKKQREGERLANWVKAFEGSPREVAAAKDLFRKDFEKARENGVSDDRLMEIIDHGAANGMFTEREAEDLKARIRPNLKTEEMHYPDGSAYREWMSRRHQIGDHPTSYLSGHSSGKVREAAKQNPGLGLVITPANPSYVKHGGDYSHIMIDNGAFSEFTGKAPFSEDKFFALLDSVIAAGLKDKVQFVVVPDKVGDWEGTNERWKQFRDRVKSYGMPLAYVGQDGIEQHQDTIPWDEFDVFFIGGSTAWKLGYDPSGEYQDFQRPTDDELRKAGILRGHLDLIREVKSKGKKIHMGRVNSWKRMEMANYGMQVDSADGNYIGAAPDKNLPVVLDWLNDTGGEQFKERHKILLERAMPYMNPGESFNRNIAAPANRLQNALDSGHPVDGTLVQGLADELEGRLEYWEPILEKAKEAPEGDIIVAKWGSEKSFGKAVEQQYQQQRLFFIQNARTAEKAWYQTQDTTLDDKVQRWIEGGELPYRIHGDSNRLPFVLGNGSAARKRAKSLANKLGVGVAIVQHSRTFKAFFVELPSSSIEGVAYGSQAPLNFDKDYQAIDTIAPDSGKEVSTLMDKINSNLLSVTTEKIEEDLIAKAAVEMGLQNIGFTQQTEEQDGQKTEGIEKEQVDDRSTKGDGLSEKDKEREGRIVGAKTKVGQRAAHYEVVEIDELIGSHYPFGMAVNEQFPEEWQKYQRRYESLSDEQKREVWMPKGGFDPSQVIDTTRWHDRGPTMTVEKDGKLYVVGGTRRYMMLANLYRSFEDKALDYHNALVAEADMFGLDVAAVNGMDKPILIRVIDEPGGDIPKLVDELNADAQFQKDPAAEAASLGRGVGSNTIAILRGIGDEETLAKFLDRKGVEVVYAMVADNPELKTKTPNWVKENSLTKDAKLAIQKAIMGAVISDATLINQASPRILQSVNGALAEILMLNQKGGEWSLSERIKEAITYDAEFRVKGKAATEQNIRYWMNDPQMTFLEEFKKDPDSDGYKLWRYLLEFGGARKFRNALQKTMLKEARLDDTSGGLFAEFEESMSGNEAFDLLVKGVGDIETQLDDNLRNPPSSLYQEEPDVDETIRLKALDLGIAASKAGITQFEDFIAYSVGKIGEKTTRLLGNYLTMVGKTAGMQGVRAVKDILGVQVAQGQYVQLAKETFTSVPAEQVEAGIEAAMLVLPQTAVGFSPAGSPVPGQGLMQGDFDQPADYEFTEGDYRPAVVAYARDKWGSEVAANGKPTWQNFVRWFDDSAVVDKDGKPLVVYHGGSKTIGGDIVRTPFFYMTENKDEAQSIYPGATLHEFYVRMSNPHQAGEHLDNFMDWREYAKDLKENGDIDFAEELLDSTGEALTLMEALKARGNDGIIMPGEVDERYKNYLAFNPSQIKSATGNVGTFDLGNPNMLLQSSVKTDTPAFKKWFGDSKVVDKNGNPLVVYHGTTASFTEFSDEEIGEAKGIDWGAGFYFSNRPDVSSTYAEGEGGNVMPVYLSIKNPAPMRLVNKLLDSPGAEMDVEYVRDELESRGYDGIVVKYPKNTFEYIAFRPEQIKSAIANVGTFDPSNPNMLYQEEAKAHLRNEQPATYRVLDKSEIPEKTRRVYKLMKRYKSRPGLLYPLFVKAQEGAFKKGEWYAAEVKSPRISNKDLARRPGIHSVDLPIFAQGKPSAKGQDRVWVEVEIPDISAETQAESDNSPRLPNGMRTGITERLIGTKEAYDYKTNPNAAGANAWPIAGSMKIIRVLSDADVETVLRGAGKEEWVASSLSGESQEDANRWNTLYQRAYHGSPYRFSRFTLDHIGKGEGAQMYGWGLYFADKRQVADYYREMLAKPFVRKWTIGSIPMVRTDRNGDAQYYDYSPRTSKDSDIATAAVIEEILINQIHIESAFAESGLKSAKAKTKKIVESQIETWKDEWPEAVEHAERFIKEIDRKFEMEIESPGAIYQVEIPENEDYLLWDKPMTQQSEKVKDALRGVKPEDLGLRFAVRNASGAGVYLTARKEQIGKQVDSPVDSILDLFGDATGMTLYFGLANQRGVSQTAAERWASEFLAKRGVKGIKYLDQNSRFATADEKSFNYVIFDASDIVMQEALFQQQAQGGNVKGWTKFISGTRALIGATSKADISTVIHEFAHPIRRFLLDRNVPQSKRVDITDAEIEMLEKECGAGKMVDGKWVTEWDVPAEEKFARMWEQYWFEGESPNSVLDSLFAKISRWMREIYRSVQQITGGPLNPDVRDLFDKLVQRSLTPEQRGGDTMSPGGIDSTATPKGMEWMDDLTSNANAVAEELRLIAGLLGYADPARETFQQWIDEAVSILRRDPTYGDRLIKELSDKSRNISKIEEAVLSIHLRHLKNVMNTTSDRLFAAKDAKDSVAAAQALRETDLLVNQLEELTDVINKAGSESARALVARKIALRSDFTLGNLLRMARIANAGESLSEEQVQEVTELSKRIADLEGQLEKKTQEVNDLERKLAVEQSIEDDKKQTGGKVAQSTLRKKAAEKAIGLAKKLSGIFVKKPPTDTLQQTEDEQLAEEAKEVIKAYVDAGVYSFGEFMSKFKKDIGMDVPVSARAAFSTAWAEMREQGDIPTPQMPERDAPELRRIARMIQRSLVEDGITEPEEVIDGVYESLQEIIPDITKRETMDAMSGYGQYSTLNPDPIDGIIRDLNGQYQQMAKLDDMRQGMAPKKTGGERRTPSDKERELIQQVNQMKRNSKYFITDPESQLKSIFQSTRTALRNRIYDLSRAINVTGTPIPGREGAEFEAEQAKQIAQYRKLRDELMAEYKRTFPRPGLTFEQRVAIAERAVDRAIAEMEKQLSTGDVSPKARSAPISTPALEAKRAKLDALREQRDAIRAMQNPKMTEEERAEKAYVANLLSRIADYEDRKRQGYFGPRPKKEPRELSPKELELKKQLEDLKDEFFRLSAEYRFKNMTRVEKAWDITKETMHLSRAVMTSFDLSAVFRQGGIASLAHPRLAMASSRQMMSALLSTQSEFDTMDKIQKDAVYAMAMRAGLSITTDSGKITRQEEAYMGRWAKWGIGRKGTKINTLTRKGLIPISASARAYTTFLNSMRFKLFKYMVSNLGTGGEVTLDEAKVIAAYVNAATGRAELGKFNQAAANLNTVFFAPRYVASRFQYLAMPFYLLPSTKVSGRVKKMIAMEYARHAMGLAAFLGLSVALGSLLTDDEEEKPTVEFDPRSSDFMKLRIGETRIDPMAGLSQTVTLIGQVSTGQKKKVDGEIQDLYGENRKFGDPDLWDVTTGFIRKKLAPIPGAIVDLRVGENVIGEKETPLSVATDLFMPLSAQEVTETMKARGLVGGLGVAALSLLGMGGGTYGPRTAYATADRAKRDEIFKKDLERIKWNSKEPAYKDFLTTAEMEQFDRKREQRKQALVYAASADPKRREHASDESFQESVAGRDKAFEALVDSGMTYSEVRQLLIAYYKRNYGSAYETKGGVYQMKQSLSDRLKQIRRKLGQKQTS